MDSGKTNVRNMRSKCRCSYVLQFTFRRAVCCVLHRPPSQVIHCAVLSLFPTVRVLPPWKEAKPFDRRKNFKTAAKFFHHGESYGPLRARFAESPEGNEPAGRRHFEQTDSAPRTTRKTPTGPLEGRGDLEWPRNPCPRSVRRPKGRQALGLDRSPFPPTPQEGQAKERDPARLDIRSPQGRLRPRVSLMILLQVHLQ